jgi:hypothetical protein
MNVPKRLIAVAAGVLSALTVVLSNPTSLQAANGTIGYANDVQASRIVDLVNSDPDDFAGVAGDVQGNGLTVFVVGGRGQLTSTIHQLAGIKLVLSPTIQAVLPRTSQLWSVHTATAAHSLRELNSVMAQVTTSQRWMAVALPYLRQWGVDIRANSVSVGLSTVNSRLEAEATAAFGAVVQLHQVAQNPVLLDRIYDTPPFKGGDSLNAQIDINAVEGCTAGFPAHDVANHPGLLTAGHCFNGSFKVYQGPWPENHLPPPKGLPLGWVTIRGNGSGDPNARVTDSEFVDTGPCCGGKIKGLTWGLGSSQLNISGSLSSWVGANVCFNGVVTGQNCSGHVVPGYANGCVLFPDGLYRCDLWSVNADIEPLAVPGDSGGPVYQGDGRGGVRAMGTIVGKGGTNPVTYWYADINAIGRQLNIALIFNGQVW